MIDRLREEVGNVLSPKRFEHTLGVERMVVRICQALGNGDLLKLRAAALLHDITKEYSFEKQLKICDKFGIILRADEINSPTVIHAITAAAIIPIEYPDFNDDEIISCVRWHTTGKPDMTLSEKIICLADYIEDGRCYNVCVSLRNMFFNRIGACVDWSDKLNLLDSVLLSSFENTVHYISQQGNVVNKDTLNTISSLTNKAFID